MVRGRTRRARVSKRPRLAVFESLVSAGARATSSAQGEGGTPAGLDSAEVLLPTLDVAPAVPTDRPRAPTTDPLRLVPYVHALHPDPPIDILRRMVEHLPEEFKSNPAEGQRRARERPEQY